MTPGRKFWIMTSAVLSSSTSLRQSSAFRKSAVMLSLFRFIAWNSELSPPISVSDKYKCLQRSPTPGRSTFMTRAPRSASFRPHKGPERNWLKSTTSSPSRGRSLCGSVFIVSFRGTKLQAVPVFPRRRLRCAGRRARCRLPCPETPCSRRGAVSAKRFPRFRECF